MPAAEKLAATASIVVGMSGSTGLAVVRALAEAGVACHAVHYERATAAMATRLARTYLSPDWRTQPAAFIGFLADLGNRMARGEGLEISLFVCHDAALQPVWQADERLRAAGLHPAFAAARPLETLLDKRTQLQAAASAGVAAPWTRWGSAEELEAFAEECPYPAILKPALSHLGVSALGAKALRCASSSELRDALRRAAAVEVMLQEFIPGGDAELFTAGVFACEHGHLAFTGRKLKQHPPGLGISRLSEALPAPALIPGSVALLAELGYEGISQVEYKRDARDGSYRLMEANFRPWTWMGLATAVGVNLPLAAHNWALYGAAPTGMSSPTRQGRWVWAVPEVIYTVRDLRHGRAPDISLWRGLRAEAFFSRRDPLPFMRSATAGLRQRTRRLSRLVRRALKGPAFVVNGALLRREWAAAGRRSAGGTAPAIGLPPGGRVLVVAPHPDDETIMAGATMAQLVRRGDQVEVVAVTAGQTTRVLETRPEECETPGRRAVGGRRAAAEEEVLVGDLRTSEQTAALGALGVTVVRRWDFVDRAIGEQRERLAAQLGETLAAGADVVVAPFPYDAHADHVAVALALADALERATGRLPIVLCAAVQTPLHPAWVTRLVPAGQAWGRRRAAIAAYGSRDRSIFTKSSQLAWLHPAGRFSPAEWFVELPGEAFVKCARSLEREGLTSPAARPSGHPFSIAADLLTQGAERAKITALLAACLSPAPDGDGAPDEEAAASF